MNNEKLNRKMETERGLESPDEGMPMAPGKAAEGQKGPPIYRQTMQYAMAHGERDAYFASQKAYGNCAEAISNAVNNNFDGAHLGKACVSEALETYSQERVADVLAYTVQQKAWDARFSRENREWANSIDTSHMRDSLYRPVCESHSAVLDGFISMFRREVLEQDKAEKAAVPAQRKSPERSDDLEL